MREAPASLATACGNHLDVAAALVTAGADLNHKDRTTQGAYLSPTAEVGDGPRLVEAGVDRTRRRSRGAR